LIVALAGMGLGALLAGALAALTALSIAGAAVLIAEYLIARKEDGKRAGIPPVELWVYHREGGGGIKLTSSDDVNNAGGAKGLEPVADADEDDWRWMFETNVLGTLRMTKALLPALVASGDGHVVTVTSVAGARMVEPAISGARVRVVGAPDQPHSWSYLPDVGRALALLAGRRRVAMAIRDC